MTNGERWTETERRARELFDASVEGIDGETRSKLNQARQAALDAARRRRGNPVFGWLPAAAAASIVALAVLLWRLPGDVADSPAGTADAPPAPEVVELLATSEGLAIASEDPEFYAWFEAHDAQAPNGAG